MNEWYDKYREGVVTDFSEDATEKGELEGLRTFLFVVAVLFVAFLFSLFGMSNSTRLLSAASIMLFRTSTDLERSLPILARVLLYWLRIALHLFKAVFLAL